MVGFTKMISDVSQGFSKMISDVTVDGKIHIMTSSISRMISRICRFSLSKVELYMYRIQESAGSVS